MSERSDVAAVGAIVAALAIVALARLPPSPRPTAARGARAFVQSGLAERTGPPTGALVALRDGRPIDLNCADAATLELLPGIGPALAARIVEHRRGSGPFPTVDALDAVRGIGAKTLVRVRPLLVAKPRGASGALSCPSSTTPTR